MLKFFFFMFFMFFIYFKWWLVYLVFLVLFMFMFINSFNLFLSSNIWNFMGMDFLSISMILLSIWICGLIILASFKLYISKKYNDLFMLNLLFLVVSLVLAFSSMDILYFYIFFEISILPVLLMIMGWGYQPERIQAGVYLIFYTLCVSLPLLLGIFFSYKVLNSFSFLYIYEMSSFSLILYFLMISAFLVKMPMFMVHLWLPKAHVEGPVSSSMILAGVMLKLGGYGLMRLMKLMILTSLKINFIWIVLSLIGGSLISLMCLHQMDMKMLIAYSSVVHMALVISGILSLTYLGFMGSLILMIGHGLCSSGLFVLINLMYERLGSRSLMVNKGLINLMPNMSLWWFLLLSSNMAAPPSMNLFGEITLLMSIISWSKYSLFFLMLISFFSASYSLYIFAFSQHGEVFKGIFNFSGMNMREFILLLLHWFPLNVLILKIDYFFFWM
uniref:NADH-ubiquinone oxidoreductase chain 4 n=1 Tax=Hydropsyche simulans TaxID=763302 RepID=A0A3G1NDG0_9NEOP|nr:NADH dehydrogenase subunit 4 [Hydropsyche simulans]AUT18142.1 NADH dehydrogenase subunit 4 [Hydropsyche simulans]